MRDQDDGHAEGVLNFAQQHHDGFTGGAVEIAGRLVRQQQSGAIHQRAGQRGALLFAAGKFAGAMRETLFEANAFEGFPYSPGAFAAFHFGETQGQFDVFLEVHSREKIEGLKNHADVAAAIARQLKRVQFREIAPLRENRAGSGAIQTRHEI